LGTIIEKDWEDSSRLAHALRGYSRQTIEDLLAAELLVAALYRTMGRFEQFASLCLLYFAAVSFSETARRLGQEQLTTAFLLQDQAGFREGFRQCCQQALQIRSQSQIAEDTVKLRERILRTIEPIDVAGLSDLARRNWYPVTAKDLLAGAPKIGATIPEIEEM